MEKEYFVKVNLKFAVSLQAENEEHAKFIAQEIFRQENNLELDEEEIIVQNGTMEDDVQDSLAYFIERQEKLWGDLETIEMECLSGDETLVEWLQAELFEVVRLYNKFKRGE
jgi:hypothetical protein